MEEAISSLIELCFVGKKKGEVEAVFMVRYGADRVKRWETLV
jgi:hypothetical protein